MGVICILSLILPSSFNRVEFCKPRRPQTPNSPTSPQPLRPQPCAIVPPSPLNCFHFRFSVQDVAAHGYNPCSLDAKAEGLMQVQGQLML